MINLFQPTLGDGELAAIREVFESAWLGKGPRTSAFEERFGAHLGVGPEHMVSTTSCTEGLFQSMELLGIEAGDEVIMPTIHFVGAGNAVASRGAVPVFCDVDPRTLNARVEDIEPLITDRTRALILIHYGGLPADLPGICALARDRGIKVIEDSACSISSSIDGRACGTWGDVGIWSFDAMKLLVTGDGGMLYIKDPELAARARTRTYLGLESKSGFSQAGAANRWWEFEISSFSSRQILNDVTAAMGLVQLDRLPGFIARRREIHEAYDRALSGLEWLETPPPVPAGAESSYYFYWLQMDGARRDELAQAMLDAEIYTTFRYWPLHLVELYGSKASLPHAEAAARTTLCIPIHQALTDDDVTKVTEAVIAFDRVNVGA